MSWGVAAADAGLAMPVCGTVKVVTLSRSTFPLTIISFSLMTHVGRQMEGLTHVRKQINLGLTSPVSENRG